MSQAKGPQKRRASKHIWYSITPLLMTLLTIVLINWAWPNLEGEQPATVFTPTAVAIQPTTLAATRTRPPILPATILPSPVPTSTPRPELPLTATITLLGPPSASSIGLNGRLTMYWTYAEPLRPGQQFVLTLRQNDTVVSTQSLAEMNFGSGYQLSLDLAALPLAPGTAVWQLQLEWADDTQLLLTSETRTIVLLAE